MRRRRGFDMVHGPCTVVHGPLSLPRWSPTASGLKRSLLVSSTSSTASCTVCSEPARPQGPQRRRPPPSIHRSASKHAAVSRWEHPLACSTLGYLCNGDHLISRSCKVRNSSPAVVRVASPDCPEHTNGPLIDVSGRVSYPPTHCKLQRNAPKRGRQAG